MLLQIPKKIHQKNIISKLLREKDGRLVYWREITVCSLFSDPLV